MIRKEIKKIADKLKRMKDRVGKIPGIIKKAVRQETAFIGSAQMIDTRQARLIKKGLFYAGDLFFILAVTAVVFHYISLGTVVGNSMIPTFRGGQKYIGLNVCQDYRRDDVILVAVSDKEQTETETLIKRIIGLPGDTIQIVNGELYRNGQLVIENFSKGKNGEPMQVILGDEEYFVMGDNREHSYDSRNFGPVSRDQILCKVVKVW